MKKRVLALALALILALSLLPFGALAAEDSVIAPYRKVLREIQSSGAVNANGLFVYLDDDDVPELLICYQLLNPNEKTEVRLYTLKNGEPKFLLTDTNSDFGYTEARTDKSISIVNHNDSLQLLVMYREYYLWLPNDPQYGPLYEHRGSFAFFDYADGNVKRTERWCYHFLELEDGRYFENRSEIHRNGKNASPEALVKALNSFQVLLTISPTDDTNGYPLEALLAMTMGKFIDVPPAAYYAEPVDWAVAKGITNGTSALTFSPEDPCTRGQVVTFLWRAAGEPKPESAKNPFKDVKKGAYYYDAVLWAVEQGITNGTSANAFSPGDPCTRGQVVTFLYRNAGSPEVKAKNPFRDVSSGAYYYNPVLWAVKNEITNGTSATAFSPGQTCTRGQIVTFLFRNLSKPGELSPGAGRVTLASSGEYEYDEEVVQQLATLLNVNAETAVMFASGNGISNLEALAKGEIQMCVCTQAAASCAYNGTGLFAGSGPYRDFSVVAALYTTPLNIITLDPELQSVEDLRGKKVAVGEKGSSLYCMAMDILNVYGLTEADIQPVYLNFDDTVEAMKHREIDVMFSMMVRSSSLTSHYDVRNCYPILLDDAHMNALIDLGSSYVRNDENNVHNKGIIFFRMLLLARNDVSEYDVDQILSTMFDSDLLSRTRLVNLTPAFAYSVSDLPYHPGAVAYYESRQPA